MNKYQEALDEIKNITYIQDNGYEQDNVEYWHQEAIDTLQELVDKSKEKFVLCPKGWKGHRYTRYYCPNCKKPVKNDDSHCHNCGQNIKFPKIEVTNNKAYLDWSEDDE